ncbi:MAG: hypothetical protein U0640_10910 [Phycisphaerales bacterium]
MTKRKTHPAAIAMLIIGILLLAAGITIFAGSVRARSKFKEARDIPIASLDIDVSRRGTITHPVTVKYEYCHGLHLRLHGPPTTSKPEPGEPIEPWLKSIDGSATIEYASASWTQTTRLRSLGRRAPFPDELAFVPAGSPGVYSVTIDITHPAQKLSGVPHKLSVYQDVCGCELLLDIPFRIAAGLLMFIGFGFYIPVALSTFRRPQQS